MEISSADTMTTAEMVKKLFFESELSKLHESGTGPAICIEVGAANGISGSNTLELENEGWKCILIEPRPKAFSLLRQNRPRSIAYSCAVSSHSQKQGFLEHLSLGGLSTLLPPKSHHSALLEKMPQEFQMHTVEVKTLNAILEELNLEHVDFVSIDVEGYELEVLKGFDLKKYSPVALAIEDNNHLPDPDLREFLEKSGYQYLTRTGCDDWFVHGDIPFFGGYPIS